MPALDEIYAAEIAAYNASQTVVSVTLAGGEVLAFRRYQALFPTLLNHRACQTLKHAPLAIWNNEEVISALSKLTESSAGKFLAFVVGMAAAELWAKTVACDWISGDQGAVLWLEPTAMIPGMTFHVSPPKVARYPGPAAAPYVNSFMADIQDGSIQIGGAQITLSGGAVNGLNKAADKARNAYGKLVKRGWAKG
jgi:hypothetical protein